MTRFMLVLGALSLTNALPAAPAFADQPWSGDLGVVDFCKNDVATNHPDLSVGNCIGSRTTYYHSNDWEGWAEHVCFFIQTEQPDDFYSFYDSYTDCVHDKAAALIYG